MEEAPGVYLLLLAFMIIWVDGSASGEALRAARSGGSAQAAGTVLCDPLQEGCSWGFTVIFS